MGTPCREFLLLRRRSWQREGKIIIATGLKGTTSVSIQISWGWVPDFHRSSDSIRGLMTLFSIKLQKNPINWNESCKSLPHLSLASGAPIFLLINTSCNGTLLKLKIHEKAILVLPFVQVHSSSFPKKCYYYALEQDLLAKRKRKTHKRLCTFSMCPDSPFV